LYAFIVVDAMPVWAARQSLSAGLKAHQTIGDTGRLEMRSLPAFDFGFQPFFQPFLNHEKGNQTMAISIPVKVSRNSKHGGASCNILQDS
jgi:hypothetical protein